MAGRRNWFNISTMVCPDCGTEMPIPRNHAKSRERGHIKDLYCPKCRKIQKFKEYNYKNSYKTLNGEILSV